MGEETKQTLKSRLEAIWNDSKVRSATGYTIWRISPYQGNCNWPADEYGEDLFYRKTTVMCRVPKRRRKRK